MHDRVLERLLKNYILKGVVKGQKLLKELRNYLIVSSIISKTSNNIDTQ